jgi:hypothetical protein
MPPLLLFIFNLKITSMKNRILFILISLSIFSSMKLTAQSWRVDGNTLIADSRLGSNNAFDVLFETNSLERGRITRSGNWGIGTTTPFSKLHVSTANDQGLRVDINNAQKFIVESNGGVSIGSSAFPPSNGLVVFGNTGIGASPSSQVKLHVFGGTDVNPGGDGGYIVAGSVNATNIAIDDNEIMARNNGVASTLTFNQDGGNIIINGTNAKNSKVGINTNTPAVDLHLLHGARITGTPINFGLRLTNEGSHNEDWTIYTQDSDGFLQLWENGVLRGQFNDATGAYSTVSDIRRKKDIEKAPELLDKILKLDVKKYHMLENASADKKNYGLIAQEVEKIFPEVVSHNMQDDGTDLYTLDYSAFGVLAVKALQEMHQIVRSQQQKIDTLQNLIMDLQTNCCNKANSIGEGSNSDATTNGKEISGVLLGQNQPNPFNQTTTIHYTIPRGTNAQIMIYDVSGKLVKTERATQSGQTQIDGFNFKAGVYTYTLMINGKLAASKKMVITK